MLEEFLRIKLSLYDEGILITHNYGKKPAPGYIQ